MAANQIKHDIWLLCFARGLIIAAAIATTAAIAEAAEDLIGKNQWKEENRQNPLNRMPAEEARIGETEEDHHIGERRKTNIQGHVNSHHGKGHEFLKNLNIVKLHNRSWREFVWID
jgi:hypothetical protein